MLIAIVERTPPWVWVLLIGLIALGLSQSLPRAVTLKRLTVLPAALLALSLLGVVSTFGQQPLAWLAWAAGVAMACAAGYGRLGMQGARFDASQLRVQMPGSFVPLGLFLALFMLKFGVGVELAQDNSLRSVGSFAITVGLLYGLFSGLFLSRSLTGWMLARRALATQTSLAG